MDWRKLDAGNRAEPRHSSRGNGGEHRERAKTQTKGDVRAAPKASLSPETPVFAAAGLSLAGLLSGAYRRVAMNTLGVLGAGIWALTFLGFLSSRLVARHSLP